MFPINYIWLQAVAFTFLEYIGYPVPFSDPNQADVAVEYETS